MHKADLREKIVQRNRENRAAQIAGDRVVQRRLVFAETVQADSALGIEKRLEEGQAANMVGMKMRKANINIRHALFHQLAAQMDKAGTGIKYR